MGPRYATLDGLRGAAALLVALYHFQQRHAGFVIPGYLAVDMFFALSGFVIARIYVPKLEAGLAPLAFARIRIVRLYPLYLAGMLLGVAMQPSLAAMRDPAALSPVVTMGAVVTEALMLPTPGNLALFPLNGPAWSLFFELAVNIAFAVLLWRLRTRAIAGLMAGAAILIAGGIVAPAYFNVGWAWNEFGLGAARALYSFSAGMLICRFTAEARGGATWLALAPVAVAAAIIAWPAPVDRVAWELLCVLALLPALVALAARIEPPAALRRVFGAAGALSYPLYAIHWPLLAILGPVLLTMSPLAGAALFFAVLIPAAWLAARYWEPPVRRLVRAALDARPAALLTTTRPAAP